MEVRFTQAISGFNPDGTALFVDVGEVRDWPDVEVHRLIGGGICEAVNPKDQGAALKKFAKLKDDEAKAAEAEAERLRNEQTKLKKADPKTGESGEARAKKGFEANQAEDRAHEKRMEAERAKDAINLNAAATGEDPKETAKKLKAVDVEANRAKADKPS